LIYYDRICALLRPLSRSTSELRHPPFSRRGKDGALVSLSSVLNSLVQGVKAGIGLPLDRLLLDFRLDGGACVSAAAGGRCVA